MPGNQNQNEGQGRNFSLEGQMMIIFEMDIRSTIIFDNDNNN